ncbi:hypothetical protein ABBQ32_008628 [Trebouxia sp. C0010 RCD-2024]
MPSIDSFGIGIVGIGSYLPSRCVTNQEIETFVDTTADWIASRTGIQERRYASAGTCTSDLATKAAVSALGSANLSANDVGLTVLGTSTPDWTLPSTACHVQQKLGVPSGPAFDVSAVCSGFIYAMTVAHSLFNLCCSSSYALVIGAETFSKLLDFQDRTSSVFFGDGAGAVVLGSVPAGYGILASELTANGDLHDNIKVPAGGSHLPASEDTLRKRLHCFRMDGRAVWDYVTSIIPQIVPSVLQKAGLDLPDIDLFIFHQANYIMVNHCAKQLGIDAARVHYTVEKYGNTAAASIPITLHDALQQGKLHRGSVVMLVTVGGGMTAAASIMRWY